MDDRLRLLVIDGNTRATNAHNLAAGGSATGPAYREVLESLGQPVDVTILEAAEADTALPQGVRLGDFDGVAWSGSALNIYEASPPVERQIALARDVFAAGVPIFGSCWGLQVTAVAAGGVVRRNPRGRELGVARHVTLSDAGRDHPLYRGRPCVFDALCVHLDEVETLPPQSVVLAGNRVSSIQAAEIRSGGGVCWGVQYHPEFDFATIATVVTRYGHRLVESGFFPDDAAQARFVADWRQLQQQPERRDLAWIYGLEPSVTDAAERRRDLANWLEHMVKPRAAART